jgi:hypothetical protein
MKYLILRDTKTIIVLTYFSCTDTIYGIFIYRQIPYIVFASKGMKIYAKSFKKE